MQRKAKIIIAILIIIPLALSCMFFDDEIKNWYHYNLGQKMMSSTLSPNVHVFEDMADIQSLNRKRTLKIYIPASYETSNKRYPVIYMTDGGRLFDNKTTGTRGEEGLDEFLDEAIANGGSEVIIVGINSSEFRSTELNPYDDRNTEGENEAIKYMNYIVNDLKPIIDSKYRTLPDRTNTAIMGASLGGLFAVYTIMKHSDVFSKAGVLSPSLFYSEEVFTLPVQMTNKDVKIYMNVGGQEFVMMKTVMRIMEQSLKAAGLTDDQIMTKVYKNGGHEPKVWADGFQEAYRWWF